MATNFFLPGRPSEPDCRNHQRHAALTSYLGLPFYQEVRFERPQIALEVIFPFQRGRGTRAK